MAARLRIFYALLLGSSYRIGKVSQDQTKGKNMSQLDLTQLTSNSTLANLETHNFQIDITVTGQVVSENFQNHPEIPGVIVTDRGRMVGMISQNRFLERMSQPYSLEIYLKRPIKVLLNSLTNQALQLPSSCKIELAARSALGRAAELLYEPIVVVTQDNQLRLLNMNVLLLAQSQVLAALQVENQKRNQILEQQQTELQQQAREISELNQQFIRISQVLSQEGKEAFFATFTGVNSICRGTDKIVTTGKALQSELETVDDTTKMIENVSKQVRRLAVQAALIVSKSGGEIPGLTPIATEMRSLGEQTFETSSQVTQLANRFKVLVQELTEAAQTGEITARSLLQKNLQAQVAFTELEKLVELHKSQETTTSSSPVYTLA